ncbi:tRNA uridine(34) 5-carboxymethylaminomethyl modification radical SAM/GNAT enzyme Elp3 [Candidatus Micrarchaeota archaeon]|nr:tRNA uridine(34) 5-carboxymethylaminomethyl modification radical SAM/GNAT enzyme Elp3 [Candidatus Micrarchaeota archaeon]
MTLAKAQAIQYCVEQLPSISSKRELEQLRKKASKKFGLTEPVKTSDVFLALPESQRSNPLLQTRRVKSASGVTVIAVMTAPLACPGKCIFCPPAVLAAKSYTGFEPAALRARQNNYDSRLQVLHRLRQLTAQGHAPEKCDVIVMGGTFNSLPLKYQDEFVKGIYDGFNGFISESVQEAVRANETAPHRVVALTFETRPDWIDELQLNHFLDFGATRIEIGLQSLDDAVLEKVKRGHDSAETARATRECKEKFFKVCHHFMPGLFSNKEKDVKMFKEIFSNPAYRPDMIKIYPCLVIPNTPLYDLWEKGEFTPYTAKEAADVISECMKHVPKYCRIMRINRDIPTSKIAAGVEHSNLRQMVDDDCKKKGIQLKDIRAREVGFTEKVDYSKAKLSVLEYDASGGKEFFISIDSGEALIGFCRMRLTSDGRTGIRELRVFGSQVNIGDHSEKAAQHKSFGKQLLSKAESLAKENNSKKMFVISGVGVREYYAKQGYSREGNYMTKKL